MRWLATFPISPRYQAGYLRVTHPFATRKEQAPSFSVLLVASTPPAFILSQTQTLIKIIVCLKLICHWTDLLFFSYSVLHLSCMPRALSCSVFVLSPRATTILVVTSMKSCQYLFLFSSCCFLS